MHILWCFLMSLPLAHADKIDDLTRRVNELEKAQTESLLFDKEGGNQVNSFHNNYFTLGGFFEHTTTILEGDKTPFQINSGNAVLGLNLSAEYNRQLRFVSQFITFLNVPLSNPHQDPFGSTVGLPNQRIYQSVQYGALVAQAYLEYTTKAGLHVQGGMGYVPYGHSFQIREPVLFIRRGGPQMLRTTNLVSPFWTGINISQEFKLKNARWGFATYTFTDFAYARMPGLGARVWLKPSRNILIGVSNQIAKQQIETYNAFGYDFQIKIDQLTINTEFTRQFGVSQKPWSIYIEPNFALENQEWIIYTFADYADSPANMTLTRKDPYQKWEFGLGLNWLPVSYTRLRTGFTVHDYVNNSAMIRNQDRDYFTWEFSAGVAF